MSRFIIFGCGKEGKKAFASLGADRVIAFTDNDRSLWKAVYRGKRVISLQEMQALSHEHIVLIAASMERGAAIAEQLETMGVSNYLFWRELSQMTDWDQASVDTTANLLFLKNEYKELFQQERSQSDWLKAHTDIRKLRPARGKLRDLQMKLVNFTADFFEETNAPKIHPILSAGNLLGYVRHHGFVPWDDDIDLKLIRSEYDIFLSWCKENLPVERYEGRNRYIVHGYWGGELIWINEMLGKHPNETFLIISPYHLRIVRGTSLLDWLSFDVFSLDCYRNDLDFMQHRQHIEAVGEDIMFCHTAIEQYELIENFIQEDKTNWDENGENIFYGIDNIESYNYYVKNRDWQHKDNIFPLHLAKYEGRDFYIPNRPEECLKYVFGSGYMDYPQMIGISHDYSSVVIHGDN